MFSMSENTKRLKSESSNLCQLCCTRECTQDSSEGSTSAHNMSDESAVRLPEKETIGQLLHSLPNEVIHLVLRNMSLSDLSNITLTNKWFRDFILQYFFESKIGLSSLLGPNRLAVNAKTSAQQNRRLDIFFELGLLLKRVTCLLPTPQRIELLVIVLNQLDGIPRISLNPMENQNMRFVFQCYGRLIRHLVSGWDDCELKLVFKTLQKITQMEESIKVVAKNPIGARNSHEYYIRSFYRMVCIDPNRPNTRSDDTLKSSDDDRVFWMNAIMRKHSLSLRARLFLIVFGPLISQSPIPSSIPYIGYWDLTDTYFIDSGLEELGDALRILYLQSDTVEQRNNVISLMETIMKIPTHWLPENVSSLLYYCGDQITFDFLMTKIEMGNYSDVAQKLVYLTLVSHKLTKDTTNVYNLIEELATSEHRINLYNEITTAFVEALTDIENAIELEDERDVCEVHEMIEANNDLFKNFMIGSIDNSSQQSKCSQCSKIEAKYVNVVQVLPPNEG